MINSTYKGYLVRKRFGQIFLNDQFVIDDIVSILNPQKEQAMVEIGPGLAALTKPIIEYLNKLIVIEIDREFVKRLKANHFLGPKLIIYQQDVMTIDFKQLSKKIGQPLRVFGNLPYNISTSVMFHLFKYTDAIIDMHFMLQKEVVERLIAKPNSKKYGKLSVMAQYFCDINIVLEVSPYAFMPIPKVNSALVRLIPHKILPYPIKILQSLNFITNKAFTQRRKTIHNSLRSLFSDEVLAKLGINSRMRAENISVEQYYKMANHMNMINIKPLDNF